MNARNIALVSLGAQVHYSPIEEGAMRTHRHPIALSKNADSLNFAKTRLGQPHHNSIQILEASVASVTHGNDLQFKQLN
jgi:hypothetical protein